MNRTFSSGKAGGGFGGLSLAYYIFRFLRCPPWYSPCSYPEAEHALRVARDLDPRSCAFIWRNITVTTLKTGATGAPPDSPTTPPANPPSDAKEASEREKRYRQERNDAKKELAAVSARLAELENERKTSSDKQLAEQGEFKKLAESRAVEIEQLKKAHADELAGFKTKLNDQLVGSALREQLAARGVTDKKAQDFLLPGLRSAIKAKVTADFEVEVSDWTAIDEPLKTLGFKIPDKGADDKTKAADTKPATTTPAPTLNPSAAILSHQLPGSHEPQPGADLRSGFIKAAKG